MRADESDVAPLSVAVLAGGRSSRMGTDKALLRLRDDGPPLLGLVLAAVRPLTDDAFVVASGRPVYAEFGARVVPDVAGDAGTLTGIATALRAARYDAVLVVACDMPFLSLPLLDWMWRRDRDYDVLVPRLQGESRQGGQLVYQTLHAIYRTTCLAPIERSIAGQQRRVIGFFADVTVAPIEEAQVRELDPDLRSFFNANTPESLAIARNLATTS